MIRYIDENCNGHLFCLGGVSLGGQIVIEMLSQRADLAEKAIIDGCICIPQPRLKKYCISLIRWCGGMMFGKTACKLQIAMLKLMPSVRFPEEIEEYYMLDMPNLRMETLYTIYRTYMGEYTLKDEISRTNAKIMYCYGQKEMKCVKESAKRFKERVSSCSIHELKGCNHAYYAIYLPKEWLKMVEPFLKESEI